MKKLSIYSLLTILVAGCVPSWNALYTDKDLVSDPALVGVWAEDNEKETWEFSEDGDKKYKLVQTDKNGHHAEFVVHLLKLKDARFMDLYLAKAGDGDLNVWAGAALLPAHLFLKVQQIGPTLDFAVMDPDWLKEFLQKNPKAIRHEKLKEEERVVLTAPTADLQAFLLQHLNDKLFGDASNLKRKAAKN